MNLAPLAGCHAYKTNNTGALMSNSAHETPYIPLGPFRFDCHFCTIALSYQTSSKAS